MKEIKFKICSCQKDKIDLWINFTKALEDTLKIKVKVSLFENLFHELEADLLYVPFSLSSELLKKNYTPIAKFKAQKDNYLVIGNETLEKIKEKEKIKFILLPYPFYFSLLLYTLYNFSLDFSKTLAITVNSYDEIIQKILNKEGDLGLLPETRVKPYKDNFLFLEKLPFEGFHYFLVSFKSDLFSKIKDALLSINEEYVKSLGFEEIEGLTSWEEAFIKNSQFLGDFLPNTLEKLTILDTFLNSPYFGIGIYHDTYIYANSYLYNLLNYPLEEFKKLKPEEILYYEKDKIFAKEIVKKRLNGEFFILPYQERTLKTKEGKKVETLIFTNTIFYQNKYCGMVVAIDITKEKILQKFVNLLRKVNQTLITCDSEKEVYERVCPEIYKILELKALYLGKSKYEKEIIEPVLTFPEDLKFLKTWQFSLPWGKSIKTISNLETSDFPYKEDLLSIGVNSIALIPIQKKGQTKSLLILCSEEPIFFDENKDFIEDLKEDLSFTIQKVEILFENYVIKEFIKLSEEIFIISDEKGNIEYINPFGYRLLSKIEEDLLEANCFKLLHIPSDIIKELEKGEVRRIGTFSKPEKEQLLLELKISLVKLPDEVRKIIIYGKDLTKELEFEKERQALQYFDSLTGLLNYYGFSKKVSEVLSFLKTFALFIIIDLRNFTYINRFYGFKVGDLCLEELGKKISALVRKNGIVGRTGEDEFSLFIIDVKKDEISEWLSKIKNLFSEPLELKGNLIYLEYNGAVVIYPDDGQTFETLWEKLTLLLTETKKGGANVIEILNPLIEDEVEKTFKIDTLIRKALKENLFVFYYQPYFETQSLKIVGLEALVRIKEKERLILPSEFIEQLEDSPYLMDFEILSFRKNLENLKKWKMPISVNISVKTFKNINFKKFFSSFEEILSSFPFFLTLEITERALAEDVENVKKFLETIKSFKVKIALDDFGKGYSVLSYLKDLPFDILKIDRSFTKNLIDDHKTPKIVETIIDLARGLGIKSLAEGVETKEQFECLKKLDCDYVQGFFLCQPLPEEEIEKFFHISYF